MIHIRNSAVQLAVDLSFTIDNSNQPGGPQSYNLWYSRWFRSHGFLGHTPFQKAVKGISTYLINQALKVILCPFILGLETSDS